MSIILITTLVITLIGILVGAGLVYTGKKFHVEVDEKESAVRAALPGNNCGGCGYAGCDALAAAIAKGEAPVNSCPVGGAPVTKAIGEIMGTEAEAPEPKVAFVRCKGTCAVTKNRAITSEFPTARRPFWAVSARRTAITAALASAPACARVRNTPSGSSTASPSSAAQNASAAAYASNRARRGSSSWSR